METDIIIIGAGPAGSASALSFRRRGYNVAVLEKRFMPRSKVCGEMVAPLGVKELKRLGVFEKIASAGGNTVRRIIFYSAKRGRAAEFIFPEGEYGMAISRERLDTLLLEAARENGAEAVEGFRVENVEREKDAPYYRVKGTQGKTGVSETFRSRAVINASGLRGFGAKSNEYREYLYAFKVHLRGISCADAAELFFYEGGYGGLVEIEDGLVNLAFQVQKKQISYMTDHPLEILKRILPPSHPVYGRLAEAEPVGWWDAMGSVFARRKRPFPGVWNIGDASGIIDPFTGLGISLALQGGRVLGETLDPDQEKTVYDLKRGMNRKRFMTVGIMRSLVFRPGLCDLIMKHATSSAHLGNLIIRLLHT
jgi:flavin-dependent dehydrogenase